MKLNGRGGPETLGVGDLRCLSEVAAANGTLCADL
jgi:hypothetical protein